MTQKNPTPPRGKIKFFNADAGWGFICEASTNEDVFFHVSQVVSDLTSPLYEGEMVNYKVVIGSRGKPEAQQIERLEAVISDQRTGRVKWYDPEKKFGFLEQDHGPDVFVHKSDLWHPDVGLVEGEVVKFFVRNGRNGKPRAFSVEPV